MSDKDRLDEYFERTTPEAAEAARAAMDFILGLDPEISWKLNKATIDFRAERQFCSLWPVKNHVTFWITSDGSLPDPEGRLHGSGRTGNLQLEGPEDFDDAVKALVEGSYRTEGLRPLKSKRRQGD